MTDLELLTNWKNLEADFLQIKQKVNTTFQRALLLSSKEAQNPSILKSNSLFTSKHIDMSEKNVLPIDHLKPIARIVGTTVNGIINMDENGDGEIQTREILGSVGSVAFSVLGENLNLKEAGRESLDLTEEEKSELTQIIVENSQFEQPKATALVERAVKIVLDIFDFIVDLKRPEEAFEA